MPRTEEEKIGGYITVHVGDEARRLPTLKIADSRGWKKLMSDRFGAEFGLALISSPDGQMQQLQALDGLGTAALVDLIVAYDKTKVLGGKKGIEATLDDDQILTLYNTLVEVSFPFAFGLMATVARPAGPSGGVSSPSSPSPNGASGLTVSPPS